MLLTITVFSISIITLKWTKLQLHHRKPFYEDQGLVKCWIPWYKLLKSSRLYLYSILYYCIYCIGITRRMLPQNTIVNHSTFIESKIRLMYTKLSEKSVFEMEILGLLRRIFSYIFVSDKYWNCLQWVDNKAEQI